MAAGKTVKAAAPATPLERLRAECDSRLLSWIIYSNPGPLEVVFTIAISEFLADLCSGRCLFTCCVTSDKECSSDNRACEILAAEAMDNRREWSIEYTEPEMKAKGFINEFWGPPGRANIFPAWRYRYGIFDVGALMRFPGKYESKKSWEIPSLEEAAKFVENNPKEIKKYAHYGLCF